MSTREIAERMPRDILVFETIQIASIVIFVLHDFAVPADGAPATIVNALIELLLTLLVSRGRKNWARWVIIILTVIGLIWLAWDPAEVLTIGYPSLTIAVWVLQIVAAGLLLTRQSAHWIRSRTVRA